MNNSIFKLFSQILFIIISLMLFSCEKEITTDDPSFITYYVRITLNGNEIITIPKGTSFVDPGFTATENNVDVTNKVIITGEVDTNKIGLYNIKYKVYNKDGFPSSIIRKVIVYDPEAPNINIKGIYKSTVIRPPINNKYKLEQYKDLIVKIDSIAPGFFYISDLLGGFYEQGRNYGKNYAMYGYFSLNSDFSLNLIESFVPGWKMSLSKLEGSYDTLSGSINYIAYFDEFTFFITLTK